MNFLDKTCNISKIETTYPNWEAIETETPIYTWIKCDFYKWSQWWSWKYDKDKFELEWTNYDYDVVLDWDKILVQKGYIIELIDTIQNYWKYIISDLLIYRKPNWRIDNITLKVTEIAK